MPAAQTTGAAHVNGIAMYYATFGAGRPVLLIHGGCAHADVWGAQVADLMRDHLVIVADSRGHGRSTSDDRPISYGLMASDYLALLDHLGIEQVDLVGWSDGANIGFCIAMSDPARLRRLVANAGNINLTGFNRSGEDSPVFNALVKVLRADYDRLSVTGTPYDDFVNSLMKMWKIEPDWTDAEVAAITVPTLILTGDKDEAILTSHSAHIVALIPRAKLVVLPQSGHFAMVEVPGAFNAAVRAFLD